MGASAAYWVEAEMFLEATQVLSERGTPQSKSTLRRMLLAAAGFGNASAGGSFPDAPIEAWARVAWDLPEPRHLGVAFEAAWRKVANSAWGQSQEADGLRAGRWAA